MDKHSRSQTFLLVLSRFWAIRSVLHFLNNFRVSPKRTRRINSSCHRIYVLSRIKVLQILKYLKILILLFSSFYFYTKTLILEAFGKKWFSNSKANHRINNWVNHRLIKTDCGMFVIFFCIWFHLFQDVCLESLKIVKKMPRFWHLLNTDDQNCHLVWCYECMGTL